MLASAAVPIALPPVVVDGRSLVDAGTVADTPLAPMMDYEPGAVIVVSGGGGARPAPSPSSLGDTIGLLVDNLAHFALHADRIMGFGYARAVEALAGWEWRTPPRTMNAPPIV